MIKKTPKNSETIHEFECECGWLYFLNEFQVANQQLVACHCGEVFEVKTDKIEHTPQVKSISQRSSKVEQAVKILISQGFSTEDIKKSYLSKTFSAEQSVEEIIQQIIEGM
jgi:hypothetical protein